jgi:ParB-like chromosome segregation protein Spo0J
VVAPNELRLLYRSIEADGYTQPVVTVYNPERDKYIIVDGYHRYLVLKYHKDIADRTGGHLPIVVIAKGLNERMASTIRHNRARGKHQIAGMARVVFDMLDGGMTDEAICRELGLEADELIRLKYVTGFAKLFENIEYQRAWETRKQIKIRREYEDNGGKK